MTQATLTDVEIELEPERGDYVRTSWDDGLQAFRTFAYFAELDLEVSGLPVVTFAPNAAHYEASVERALALTNENALLERDNADLRAELKPFAQWPLVEDEATGRLVDCAPSNVLGWTESHRRLAAEVANLRFALRERDNEIEALKRELELERATHLQNRSTVTIEADGRSGPSRESLVCEFYYRWIDQ